MSDIFHLSDSLSAELVALSSVTEQQQMQQWIGLDADIQSLLEDQPSFKSVLQNELNRVFPEAGGALDPERVMVELKKDSAPATLDAVQPLTVMDTVLDSLRTGIYFPFYPKKNLSVSMPASPAAIALDVARFQVFAEDMLVNLKTHVIQQSVEYWQEQGPLTGTQSRKAWLLDKLSKVLRAEARLLTNDSTLPAEHVLMVDQVLRYTTLTARGALPTHSRPAVYAMALKAKDQAQPIPFAGALVITEQDGSGSSDQFGAFTIPLKTSTVQISSSASAGRVVLYTPSGGLVGFDSLQALNSEIERRWQGIIEFESLLELLSTEDLERVQKWPRGPQSPLDLVFTEIQESFLEHVFTAHDNQRQQDMIYTVLRCAKVPSAVFTEDLRHTLDYVRRFKQANAISARAYKHIAKKTRDWLQKASSEDREAWLNASEQYRALSLIANQDGEPAPYQFGDRTFVLRYAREQLKRHMQLEYGLEVDPDNILITVSAGERGAGPIIPITPWAPSSYTAVNSLSRTGPPVRLISTTRSMSELALENVSKFDIDYALTARVSTRTGTEPALAPLNADQVKQIIRAVNIGDNYEAFLQDSLIDSPKASARRETAIQQMIAQMRVDALEAKISSDYSPDRLDRGYRWVEAVLNEAEDPSKPARVEGHAISVFQLLISQATVRGVLVIGAPAVPNATGSPLELDILAPAVHYPISSLVVYTPEAPDGKRFREFENRGHMARRFINEVSFKEYFVNRVGQGDKERVRSLLNDGTRAPDVRLSLIPGNVIEQACLAEARHAIANADALITSTSEINQLTVWNSIETTVDTVTAVLPLKITAPIALGRSLLSLWNFADALKRDSQREALGHMVGMVAHWVDAGVDIGVAIARGAKVTKPAVSALDTKLSYKQDLPELTLRTDGIYAGIYEKAAKGPGSSLYFIQQENHWYQVKFDSVKRVWRVLDMRNPQAWYHSPISRDSTGLWRIGALDLGLRGGVKSTLAPFRIRVAFQNFSLEEARKLLDKFDFPEVNQQSFELNLAEYLVKHKEFPLWSNPYFRSGPGPDLDQVVPSSVASRLSNKRKAPAAPEEQPGPSTRQPVISTTIAVVEPLNEGSWKHWGKTYDAAQLSTESITPPIFKVTGPQGTYRVIEIDQLYYEILPQGQLTQGNRVFIKYPDKPCDSYEQLGLLLQENKYLQPRLAQFSNQGWHLHSPFFHMPLSHFVGSILPALKTNSKRALAKRLYTYADTSSRSLTHTRMLNINNTLHGWREGKAKPASILLGDPIALLAQGPRLSDTLYRVGQYTRNSLFDRLDLNLSASERLLLKEPDGLNKMMRQLLQRLGYEIYPEIAGGIELVFRRRASQTMNYMQLHQLRSSNIPLVKSLSESVDELIKRNPLSPLSLAMTTAKAEGKLFMLLGGVQSTPSTDLPTGFIYRT